MITLFWTVAFCLGWRIVTDEGQLLHFIRRPFENIYLDFYTEKIELAKRFDKSLVGDLKKTLLKHKLMYYFGKPFVLCITCFSSIWGVVIFVSINGFSKDLIAPMILNSISAAFIQTFIWSLYAKYLQ